MMRHFFFLLATFFVASSQAQDLERGTITSCAYQAGTAFEIQKIRQAEGDDWTKFEANIKKIYKDSQGRTDLLIIAERVFIESASTSPEDIHDQIFDACVKRQQGTESVT